MSYPGANRPHGGHHSVGDFPQPNQYGGPPAQQSPYGPPGDYQGGYNQGPPPQPPYEGPGSYNSAFPQPNVAPPPHAQYQSYNQPSGPGGYSQGPYGGEPPQNGAYMPGYGNDNQAQAPPPMHYARPNEAPPSGHFGPSQYQGPGFEPHFQPPQDQRHLYSDCSGRRKALLIGINYTGTSSALKGCHNDAKNLANFLMQRYQYKREDMVMLMDTPGAGPMDLPTKANMIRAMHWLVQDARPNDSLFFHYSGHGTQVKDTDGDEADGYDEAVCPLDFKTAGTLVDDQMHDILVRPLQQGVRLTAIFDSCHSGSSLDLPYIWSTSGAIKKPNKLSELGTGAFGAFTSYARGDVGGIFKAVTSAGRSIVNGDKAFEKTKREKTSNADVISFSGSRDNQTSADTSVGGMATGAMSHAFVAALTKYPQQSYLQLLNTIRDEIRQYSQKPQLSSSHEMDLSLLFVM